MPRIGQAPGWYGKLPELGDFAQRRLPPEFIEPWDDWLQQGLQSSRAALGEAWLEYYLGAPVWRFVLLPGVIGPGGWAGVLMPSVDRVGRYFPMTLCNALNEAAPLGPSLAGLDGWLADLEACALLALDAERGLARMERALQDLPPCPGATGPGPARPDSNNGASSHRPTAASNHALQTSAGAGFLDGMGTHIFTLALTGHTFWWHCGPDRNCQGFAQLGMPLAAQFSELMMATPSQQAADTE